uniref:PAS domain-containing protein n=1 Tax=Romanomermis culicivorax TaxID=13658 RepID=A0A915HZI0_ROMCU
MVPCSTLTSMTNNTYYLTTGGQMLTNPHFQSQNPIFVAMDDGQRISYLLGTSEEDYNLKALGGFIMVISRDGEIIYCTPNIEMYLGFHQSDILHQPIFEMVHSEDREEVKRLLHGNISESHRSRLHGFFNSDQYIDERQISARFRCFLDNTCGFLRIHIKGRILFTEPCQFSPYYWAMYGFTGGSVVALMCTPYVLPMYAECPNGDQFLRSKHSLDFRISSMDSNMTSVLEHNSTETSGDWATASLESHASFYSFIYPPDLPLVGEAHRQVIKQGISGILVYRVISAVTGKCYWLQSSCRLQNKNGKSESIICSHRILTECEGLALLDEKRTLHVRTPTWPTLHRSQSDPTFLDQTTYLSPTPCTGDHLSEASVVHQNLDARFFLADRSQYPSTLQNIDSNDFSASSTKIERYCEMTGDFSDEAQCCLNSNAIFKIPYDYSHNRTISIL